MPRSKDPYERAAISLARRHPVVRALRRAHGPLEFARPRHSAFVTLSRSIVGQQLAGAATATIWGRYARLFDGAPTPDKTLRIRTAAPSPATAGEPSTPPAKAEFPNTDRRRGDFD